MKASVLRWALLPGLALAAACSDRFEGGGQLRAKKVVLKREVEGIREIVARLERGEPMLPLDDVAIDDTLLRDLITAQLPFAMDVDRFHLTLKEAEAQFRGSPVVRLRGALNPKAKPDIEALEKERETLRGRMNELMVRDPRMKGMPDTPVKVGVPTALARDLIQRVAASFVDQVTLEIKNLKVKKSGTVKKVVAIGQYDLHVTINHVTGKLKTGKPDVAFGGNKVSLALPVTVASGTGNATIHLKWDGKNIAGATCGDMEVTQEVSGSVRPDSYPVAGGLAITEQVIWLGAYVSVEIGEEAHKAVGTGAPTGSARNGAGGTS